jgi:hypothetical protein
MDIFGYFPQSLQGADILASSDDHQKYKVFIPDWFNGEPCPIEWCDTLDTTSRGMDMALIARLQVSS